MNNLIYRGDEGKKILIASVFILFFVAVISALVGFSTFASESQKILKQDLQETLEARAVNIEADINASVTEVNALINNPIFQKTLTHPHLPKTLDPLLSSRGFSSIKIYNAQQKLVYSRGKPVASTTFSIPINLVYKARLFWENGWILQLTAPLQEKNKILGLLLIEWPLKNANYFYSYRGDLSTTEKVQVCAKGKTNEAICFPQNLTYSPFIKTLSVQNKNTPMAFALLGEKGELTGKNGDNKEVIAAYRPILSSGLGIVASIDTSELYKPIYKQWIWVLPIMLLSIGAGVLLLYWQVSPLVKKIVLSQDMLTKLAYKDSLTGLDNRAQITKNLNKALVSAKKNKRYFALFFLDLDHFKEINDTFGHEAGDLLLKTVAARLQKVVRHTDTMGRFGGDEFVIVIENILNPDFVGNKARRILDSMSEPLLIKGQEVFVRASIGVSIFPLHGENLETLMENADLALYRAKAKGRNNFQIFTPDIPVTQV